MDNAAGVIIIGPVSNSHDMLHKLVQHYDLYLQGAVSLDEINDLIEHAELILEHEDRITDLPVKHNHSILAAQDVEFEVMH